jgi:hypothetical protein
LHKTSEKGLRVCRHRQAYDDDDGCIARYVESESMATSRPLPVPPVKSFIAAATPSTMHFLLPRSMPTTGMPAEALPLPAAVVRLVPGAVQPDPSATTSLDLPLAPVPALPSGPATEATKSSGNTSSSTAHTFRNNGRHVGVIQLGGWLAITTMQSQNHTATTHSLQSLLSSSTQGNAAGAVVCHDCYCGPANAA